MSDLDVLLHLLSGEAQVPHAGPCVAETACPQMDVMDASKLVHLPREKVCVCVCARMRAVIGLQHK